MFFPRHLQWCSLAAFLQCCTLLRFSAHARPFVLLSGENVLPDDDLRPVGRARSPISYATYGTSRRMSSPHTLRLSTLSATMHGENEPVQEVLGFQGQGATTVATQQRSCHDIRKDVLVESGLQGHTDVFSDGRTAGEWDPTSASSSASDSAFVLPPGEQAAVFVVRAGPAASILQPRAAVSDPSILSVELSKVASKTSGEAASLEDPEILLSKHLCRKSGVVSVVIELPLQKLEAATSSEPLCEAMPSPIVFAYQKACNSPSHLRDSFMRALTADAPAPNGRITMSRVHQPEKPWAGIIPSGGVRTVIILILLMSLFVVVYEFGTHWFSNKVKDELINLGPVMFGCRITIESVSFTMLPHRFIYTLTSMNFANPEGEYDKEFFMHIDEVKVRFNTWKLLTTCGRVVEIRELVARHIHSNIEKDGVFFGQSNISKVMVQMEVRNKEWLASLDKIKADHGIDAAKMWNDFSAWIRKVAERVTLQEVLMEDISYSVSNKAFGMEVAIADMQYHDFSNQHNAVGVQAIGHYLSHAVLAGMSEDIAGVELGKQRFNGMVDSLKRWTGKDQKKAAPAEIQKASA